MASIVNDPNGRRRIQFVAADGKRRTIRLGKLSRRIAESIKVRVEDLVAASVSGHPPSQETTTWLENLDQGLYDKLANGGLARPRTALTLGAFLEQYIQGRSDVKESTRTIYKRVQKHLLRFFGEDKPLRQITPGDADRWRMNLIEWGLAENTVRRSCGLAKQFLKTAQRSCLIQDNPFDDLVSAVRPNSTRFAYISREQAIAVLDACPDAQWRLLFALARYGGLRVPSEALLLKWGDINWEQGWFMVTSPKTEHLEGHATRKVPIFPELLPYLQDAFEIAEDRSDFCITRYRGAATNLRTQLHRIIKRAGLEPWPKLWQNLRSTRETELTDRWPVHVASAWIGNSVAVASRHYLQVTETHFAEAAQNAAQKMHEPAGTDEKSLPQDVAGEDVSVDRFEGFHENAAPREKRGAASDGRYWTIRRVCKDQSLQGLSEIAPGRRCIIRCS